MRERATLPQSTHKAFVGESQGFTEAWSGDAVTPTHYRDGIIREVFKVYLISHLVGVGMDFGSGIVQVHYRLNLRPAIAFPLRLKERDHFVPLEHERLGVHLYERDGFRLSAAESGPWAAGPTLGRHNQQVLQELLDMDTADIEALAKDGVLS